MDYNKLIEQRQSYREFEKKAVKEKEVDAIKDYFAEAKRLGDHKLELEIVTGEESAKRLEGVVGYNGYALDAPMYMIFLGEKSDEAYIGAGFTAMDMVLKAVEVGVDTCFLGVEDSDMVKKVLRLESDLDVLAVVACGYGKKERKSERLDIVSPSDVHMEERKGYSAPKIALKDMVYRDKWGVSAEFNENDRVVEDGLLAARLAPYFFNKQYFRYVILNHSELVLCNKDDETVTHEDQMIGMGCTMFNFYVVYAGGNNVPAKWEVGGEPKLEIPEGYVYIAHMNI